MHSSHAALLALLAPVNAQWLYGVPVYGANPSSQVPTSTPGGYIPYAPESTSAPAHNISTSAVPPPPNSTLPGYYIPSPPKSTSAPAYNISTSAVPPPPESTVPGPVPATSTPLPTTSAPGGYVPHPPATSSAPGGYIPHPPATTRAPMPPATTAVQYIPHPIYPASNSSMFPGTGTGTAPPGTGNLVPPTTAPATDRIPYTIPPYGDFSLPPVTMMTSTVSGPPTCPTTLTYTPPGVLDGCDVKQYGHTATALVDCHGCEELVTSTYYNPWLGLGPACQLTTMPLPSGTTTVTSCKPSGTSPPVGSVPPSAVPSSMGGGGGDDENPGTYGPAPYQGETTQKARGWW